MLNSTTFHTAKELEAKLCILISEKVYNGRKIITFYRLTITREKISKNEYAKFDRNLVIQW